MGQRPVASSAKDEPRTPEEMSAFAVIHYNRRVEIDTIAYSDELAFSQEMSDLPPGISFVEQFASRDKADVGVFQLQYFCHGHSVEYGRDADRRATTLSALLWTLDWACEERVGARQRAGGGLRAIDTA